MAKRSLNRSDVGAWVLKGNPSIYDVVSAMEANVAFDSWRLYPSYRVELIAEDDRVVLWVTGAKRGVYAAGRVTGDPFVSEGGTRFWRDLQEQSKVRPYVPVSLVRIPPIGEASLIGDARFQNAEVVRVRQMGNPSYLTTDECAAVSDQMREADLRAAGWA